jgi:hypothetical protein
MSQALRGIIPPEAAEREGDAASLRGVAKRLRALADACDPPPLVIGTEVGEVPVAPSHEIARRIRLYLAARRRRDELLGHKWFADPAWDLLLDLLAARHEERRISISSACIAAAVPPTTALRWIGALVDAGAALRVEDPADRRRAYVEIAPDIAARLDAWVTVSLPPSA